MTTAAAISLFRVQVRILAIPLGIIAVCLLCALIPVDILRASAGAALTVCCLLSGPILFGAEYEEGARDYIKTRPISQSFVFWAKVLLLAAISYFIAAILFFAGPGIVNVFFGGIVRSVGDTMGITGIWAVVFDTILVGSISTVLAKDRIRGLLYGLVMLLPVVWFLPVINGWFFGDTSTGGIRPILQRAHLKDFAAMMSPLFVLPLLSMVYRRQLYGKIRFQPIALISIAFFLSCLFLFRWSFTNEGRYVDDCTPTLNTTLGWNGRNLVFAFPHPSRFDPTWSKENPHSDIIFKEDWSLIEPKVEDVIVLPRILPSNAKQAFLSSVAEMGSDILASYQLRQDRLGKNCILDFSKDSSGKYVIRKVFFDTVYPGRFHEVSKEEICLRANLKPAPWSSKSPDTSLLKYNLKTGEVTSATETSSMPTSIDEVLNSDALPWGSFVRNFISQNYFDGKVIPDTPKGQREFSGMRILNHFAERVSVEWDGSLDLDLGGGHQFLLNDPAPLEYWEDDGLVVVDVSDPESPQIHRTSIPWKLDGVHRLFSKVREPENPLYWLFPRSSRSDYSPLRQDLLMKSDSSFYLYRSRADCYFTTLGGGYLTLWFPYLRRVAVWRIQDGLEPTFIGTSDNLPIEPNDFMNRMSSRWLSQLAPIQREDGALGYLMERGALWLEFPALMKEDDES